MLKIIIKKFHIDKFSRFVRSSKFFYVKCFIRMLNFRSWSQSRNYFNSEFFPIYGMGKEHYFNKSSSREVREKIIIL